jgi:UPF0042 nucleotide-binding protein
MSSDPTRHEEPPRSRHLLVVTGMSGAGKSSALRALEDIGYDVVDNMPAWLLPPLLRPPGATDGQNIPDRLAVGLDSRTRDFDPDALLEMVEGLRGADGLEIDLLFLDCGTEALLRRYTETRRRHPLAADRPVMDGITRERALLTRLLGKARFVIDTGSMTVHDLKRLLTGQFGTHERGQITITVSSFSYAKGLPREADIVFDVRFLRNPHYDDALRPKTGLDPEVGAHIEEDPAFWPFFESLTALMLSLLPRYQGEGKSYLTIAFGCTGGRHRSVFLAEKLAAVLEEKGYHPGRIHRDLPED